MTDDLIEAARLARIASDDESGGFYRTVEILITEEGFVVRGTSFGEDESGKDRAISYNADLTWPEFGSNPALLANSVQLIVGKIKQSEAQG